MNAAMPSAGSHDTERPRWKTIRALKTSGFVIVCVAFLAGFTSRVPVPAAARILVPLAACLYACCWFVRPSQREGLWQFAQAADSLAWMSAMAGLVWIGSAGVWRLILLVPIVLIYLVLATIDLEKGWAEIQRRPSFHD